QRCHRPPAHSLPQHDNLLSGSCLADTRATSGKTPATCSGPRAPAEMLGERPTAALSLAPLLAAVVHQPTAQRRAVRGGRPRENGAAGGSSGVRGSALALLPPPRADLHRGCRFRRQLVGVVAGKQGLAADDEDFWVVDDAGCGTQDMRQLL